MVMATNEIVIAVKDLISLYILTCCGHVAIDEHLQYQFAPGLLMKDDPPFQGLETSALQSGHAE